MASMTNNQVEIFYLPHEGYTLTSLQTLSNNEKRTIWQNALPAGRGWSKFIGSQSTKCFRVSPDKIAFSNIDVTKQQDEYGRQGILHAKISIIPEQQYQDIVLTEYKLLLDSLKIPDRKIERLPIIEIIKQFVINRQIILASDFDSIMQYRYLEAIIYKSILSIQRGRYIIPFTTFALSPIGESLIVGLPIRYAHEHKKPFYKLPSFI